jgi:hypothetical protein
MAPSHLPSPGLTLDSQPQQLQQQSNQMTLQPRMQPQQQQQQQQLAQQTMGQKTLPPYTTPPMVGAGGQMVPNPIMVSSAGTANIPGTIHSAVKEILKLKYGSCSLMICKF